MYKIVRKRTVAENVNEYVIHAPKVVLNAKPGQFVILRADADGERVPFTIADADKPSGNVTILVQGAGYTTRRLAELCEGDSISDFAGPLGQPTDLAPYKKVLLVGGGIGTAVIYPQAKELKKQGKSADIIVGARNADLIMYEDEFRQVSDNLYITTDDGSKGRKGFVTDVVRELLAGGSYDAVFAVGPLPMMRAVCKETEGKVHTIVSMNSLMVDGTGMCGCCRVTVGGRVRYACVDGPEFDGHLIDWDEAVNRSRAYKETESEHLCRLTGDRRK